MKSLGFEIGRVKSIKPVFRIRVLFSGFGSDFISWVRIRIGKKSGSGSVKKNGQKLFKKIFYIMFFIFKTNFILARFLKNLIKEHH